MNWRIVLLAAILSAALIVGLALAETVMPGSIKHVVLLLGLL